MRIVFMGTPDFSVSALQSLIDSTHDVVGVFSQPPRPKGRGQKEQKSPVHDLAEANNIPVFTPKHLKGNDDALTDLKSLNADIAVVVAYGLLLPSEVLEAPKYGCLNIHGSILPRWRGAAPIQYAIWSGDAETGISIMQMDEGLDTGPVIAEEKVTIHQNTTASMLHDALSDLGARMIVDVLDDIAKNGKTDATDQDGAHSTYASMLKKEDGRIDLQHPAEKIDLQIRALNPWPGTWLIKPDGKRLKVLEAEVMPLLSTDDPCGTLLNKEGDLSCGDGSVLRLVKIQPENAKKMDVVSAINGGYLTVGHGVSTL